MKLSFHGLKVHYAETDSEVGCRIALADAVLRSAPISPHCLLSSEQVFENK